MARPSSPSQTRYLVWLLAPLVAVAVGVTLLAQPNAPDIQVTDGATNTVINLNDTDAFTATAMGTANTRTFTVKNTGNADLLIGETISTPLGFTVMANFPGVPNNTLADGTPAYTLAQNTSATFKVALNSATAADFSGVVSFGTNVPTKNPFQFNVTGTAVEPPSVRFVDDIDSQFAITGGWTQGITSAGTSPFNRSLTTAPAGTGTQIATWTFGNLEPGQYRVAATWPGFAGAATNSPYTVYDGTPTDATALGTVTVDQTADSAGFTDAGSAWTDLGTYPISGSTLAVQLTDNANGGVSADAVRIERVGYPGSILDDTSPQFSTTGTWTRVVDGTSSSDFQKGRSVATGTPGATPTATALWSFPVVPGTYRVVAAYARQPGNATNAPYRVFDNTTSLTPNAILLDQTKTPTDLVGGFGSGWQHLGFFTATGTQPDGSGLLVVQLSNENTGGTTTVDADAVAIELVNTATSPSAADATRFLEQATWGPAPGDVANVQNVGFNAWLNDPNLGQFNVTASSYPTLPLYNTGDQVANNTTTSCFSDGTTNGNSFRSACLRDAYSMYPLQNQFFTNAFYSPDQLRQRVGWSLHKIWVISGVDVRQSAWVAPYLQILSNNEDGAGAGTFGNYRTLMYNVTLNPGMGNYLNMNGSTQANPNENYPREIMQLFSIGLFELNPDGSQKLDGPGGASGNAIPTYDQNLVDNMTKVFTGWKLAPNPAPGIPNYIDPMRLNGTVTENPVNHDFTQKTLLRGFVQPARPSSVANAYQDLNEGLDNIYSQPSLAPFICKQLIQQLVTSNPSPGYVARVVDTFNRNSSSPYQMQGVVTAILLDPEARGDRKNATNYGHLKEPVLYINNTMRQYGALSDDLSTFSDGYLNPLAVTLGQDVFRPPSVFSYFSPAKVVVGGSPPVLGPEFQIQNTTTALARANFINQIVTPNSNRAIDVVRAHGTTPNGTDPNTGLDLIPTGSLGTAIDVSSLLPLAADPSGLADALNASLLHGTMSSDMKAGVVTAVTAVAASNSSKRVHTAIYLIASSSQYQVQQ